MDPKLRQALVAIATAVATAAVQHFTVTAPQSNRAEANRTANYEARDELRVCMRALARELDASAHTTD